MSDRQTLRLHWMPGTIVKISDIGIIEIRDTPIRHLYICYNVRAVQYHSKTGSKWSFV